MPETQLNFTFSYFLFYCSNAVHIWPECKWKAGWERERKRDGQKGRVVFLSERGGHAEPSWSAQTSGGHFMVPAPRSRHTYLKAPNWRSHDPIQVASRISQASLLWSCRRLFKRVPSPFFFFLLFLSSFWLSVIWSLSLNSSLSGHTLLCSFSLFFFPPEKVFWIWTWFWIKGFMHDGGVLFKCKFFLICVFVHLAGD